VYSNICLVQAVPEQAAEPKKGSAARAAENRIVAALRALPLHEDMMLLRTTPHREVF
jgi:hypothetical protein